MVFAGVLVFLYEWPKATLALLIALHVLIILYMGCYKPFASFSERASLMVDEMVIVCFLIYSLVVLTLQNMSQGKQRLFA